MSDSLNQLITIIDSLLVYSKNAHATAVKEVELKLSNNELLDLFAEKLACINNPPFVTAESIDKRLSLLEDGINKTISNAITEVNGCYNAKLDNIANLLKNDVRKLATELSENEQKIQAIQQKQEAELQYIKNEYANKLFATENKLQDIINNKSDESHLLINVLSENTKLLLTENSKSTKETLTTEFNKGLEGLRFENGKLFKLVADLLVDAKTPMFGGQIFKEQSQHEIIKQLIGDPSETVKLASPQTVTLSTAVTSDNIDANEVSNATIDLILNSLARHKHKSDVQKDKAAQKIRSYCSGQNPRSSLNNMNIGEYYNISKQQWKDIIDASHKEIESK